MDWFLLIMYISKLELILRIAWMPMKPQVSVNEDMALWCRVRGPWFQMAVVDKSARERRNYPRNDLRNEGEVNPVKYAVHLHSI
jgi:hypothetical protein